MGSIFKITPNPFEIVSILKKELHEWNIFFQEEHPSTQVLAKDSFHNGERGKSLFIVANQTSGRGRSDRRWFSSPFGEDITMSLLIPIQRIEKSISLLSLVGGISVVEALNWTTLKTFKSKWPNDIYHESSKVGGILSELVLSDTGNAVVMGIGINVNSSPDNIKSIESFYPIDTVSNIAGSKVDIADLVRKIIEMVESNLVLIDADHSARLQGKWIEHSLELNRSVKFRESGREWKTGIADSLTPEGYLRIRDETGGIITILVEGDVGLAEKIY
jgi:BirA family biotin operon repressor/biotin-[acetyl-CoA-carboxylase] ligase